MAVYLLRQVLLSTVSATYETGAWPPTAAQTSENILDGVVHLHGRGAKVVPGHSGRTEVLR